MFATSTKTATFLLTKFSCLFDYAREARQPSHTRQIGGAARSAVLPGQRRGANEWAAQPGSRFGKPGRFPARPLSLLGGRIALEQSTALVARRADELGQERLDYAAVFVAWLDCEQVDRSDQPA